MQNDLIECMTGNKSVLFPGVHKNSESKLWIEGNLFISLQKKKEENIL